MKTCTISRARTSRQARELYEEWLAGDAQVPAVITEDGDLHDVEEYDREELTRARRAAVRRQLVIHLNEAGAQAYRERVRNVLSARRLGGKSGSAAKPVQPAEHAGPVIFDWPLRLHEEAREFGRLQRKARRAQQHELRLLTGDCMPESDDDGAAVLRHLQFAG